METNIGKSFVVKFSVSFEPELGEAVRHAARRAGGAVRRHLRPHCHQVSADVLLDRLPSARFVDGYVPEFYAPFPFLRCVAC